MGYTKSAITSATWVSLLRSVFRTSSFIRTAFLARILTPYQFGLFGVAAIVLGLVEMFTETGINVFLIQDKHQKTLESYIDTAWYVSILRGIIVAILICISAPLITNFFNSPDSLSLLLLISLVPLIRGFINPAIVSFQKYLQFQSDFWFRSGIIIVESIVAIVSAYILQSPVSLVLGLIAGAITEVFISHRFLSLTPKFRFNSIKFKQIIHHGKWITGAGVLTYFSNKSPDIIIGKTLPKSSLGLYQMAYRLAIIPVEEVSEIINRVSFPILVKISEDKDRLKAATIKIALVYISISLPLSILLFFFSGIVTKIMLGDQWLDIIPLIRIMSLVTFFFSLNAITNPLILATKNQHYLTIISTIRFITIALTIVPLTAKYSIAGTIISLLISFITPIPIRLLFTYKILSHSTRSPRQSLHSN